MASLADQAVEDTIEDFEANGVKNAFFLWELADEVKIFCSGETGHVIGRAEYRNAERQYLVRYKAADGRAVEAWWAETALTIV